MKESKKKEYRPLTTREWHWWWLQVLKGAIPECVYRMARIRGIKK